MKWQQDLLALFGAIIGGVLGHFGFVWLIGQGFYAMVLPGGLLGLGAGIARPSSLATAIVCGILALALGLYSEWRMFPFIADESLSYFLQHVTDLKPMSMIMIVVGAAIGFWIPFRRCQESVSSNQEQ